MVLCVRAHRDPKGDRSSAEEQRVSRQHGDSPCVSVRHDQTVQQQPRKQEVRTQLYSHTYVTYRAFVSVVLLILGENFEKKKS